MKTTIGALGCAVGLALGTVACGNGVSSLGGTADAGSAGAGGTVGGGGAEGARSGAAGVAGGPLVDEAGTEGVKDASLPNNIYPLQRWCESPPPAQDLRCPATEPAPGLDVCSPLGLQCVYPPGAGVFTCIEMGGRLTWVGSGYGCGDFCPVADDGGTSVEVSAATSCAARSAVDCTDPTVTNRLSLDRELAVIGEQCSVNQRMVVFFEEGCATRIWSNVDNAAVACVAKAVADTRWLCALGVTCGLAEIHEL